MASVALQVLVQSLVLSEARDLVNLKLEDLLLKPFEIRPELFSPPRELLVLEVRRVTVSVIKILDLLDQLRTVKKLVEWTCLTQIRVSLVSVGFIE